MALTVVIDDLRVFPFEATYARTSAEGIALLSDLHERGVAIETLLLDHDLGDEGGVRDDITPVVDWLCERCVWDDPPLVGMVIVHSANPAGAAAVVRVLSRFYPTLRRSAGDIGGYVPDVRRSAD